MGDCIPAAAFFCKGIVSLEDRWMGILVKVKIWLMGPGCMSVIE